MRNQGRNFGLTARFKRSSVELAVSLMFTNITLISKFSKLELILMVFGASRSWIISFDEKFNYLSFILQPVFIIIFNILISFKASSGQGT